MAALALIGVFLASPAASAGQAGRITGVVVGSPDGRPLTDARVWIVGTRHATLTGSGGRFALAGLPAGRHVLSASLIGFADGFVEVTLDEGGAAEARIELPSQAIPLDAISVTGSRRIEKVTDAPVSLSLLTSKDLERSTELSYVGAIEGLRGVDSYRTGIANVVPNARGFTSAFNYRFRVMVDHRSAHAPTLAVPSGFSYPLMSEDIERIEAVLGPSSALYGPNAHNGLLHVITKHPADDPGTSLALSAGSRGVLATRVRHADSFQRFAYKVNAEHIRGDDWVRNDTVAIGNGGEAYLENPDHEVRSTRATGSVYLFPGEDIQLVTAAGYSRTDAVITTNTGRNQISDLTIDYQQIRLESPRFFAQVYRAGNSQGDSHSLAAKVNAMVQAANAGSPITEAEAIERVRQFEDGYRLFYEVQGNREFEVGGVPLRWVAGVQHDDMRPYSRGTLFAEGRANLDDPSTGRFQVTQTGAYGQLEADLGARWRIIAAGRYDVHDRYDGQWSPRLGVVYRLPEAGSFRLTYNRAFQAPEVLSTDLLVGAGTLLSTSIPIVVYGNGRGFTLSDGTRIPRLAPERNTTWEVGYKGRIGRRVFADVNAYRARYDDFLSSATPITDPTRGIYPTAWGEAAIDPFPTQFVLTYRNFGTLHVNGLDVGLTYDLSQRIRSWVDYSLMRVSGLEQPANDFDGDGDYDELSFNSPEQKATFGVGFADVVTTGLDVELRGRWVEAFDFVSGFYRATEAGRGTGQFQFKDRGPLGGYTSFDLSATYAVSRSTQVNASVMNVFDEPMRQSVGAPPIRRLLRTEVKHTIR